jgi:hypothetical protein
MPCLALLHTSSKYVADRHFGGLQSEHKHKYVDPPPSESSFHHPEPKTTTTLRVHLSTVYYYNNATNTPTTHSTLPLPTSLTASPPTQHNGRYHLRRVQHGIAKPPALPWPTTNPPSASCPIQIDIDMNNSHHVCLARLTLGFGASPHRYQLRIPTRTPTIATHHNTPSSDIDQHLAAWYAAIMQSICSIQYDLVLYALCVLDSEQLPVTHLTSAAISG